MALLTVNALALVLMREMDEATDNTELVSVVESWIDDAVDEIASAYDWKIFKQIDTLSTVASQSTYALSENVIDVRGIRFVDTDEPVDYSDEQNLFGVAEDLENLGKPRWWFYADTSTGTDEVVKNIRFSPIPDAIYSLTLSVQVHPSTTALITSSNIPFRKETILAIKNRVRAYKLMDDKDYEGATAYLQMFYKKLDDMIAKESKSPSAQILRMQPRDLHNQGDRRFARLDPSRFRN